MELLNYLTEKFNKIDSCVEVKVLKYTECTIYQSDDKNTIIATDGTAFAIFERVEDIANLSAEQCAEIRTYRGLFHCEKITESDMFMFGVGYEVRYYSFNK